MRMKRYILFGIWVCSFLVVAAQTPVTSLPYFCGFEQTSENANWVLNRRSGIGSSTPLPSNWTINTGAKHSGISGMYIYTTANGGTEQTAQYDGDHEVFTVAEREFSLPAGSYDLAFDWRCLGDSINDAIFVYWVPSSISLTGRTTSMLPTNATPLSFNGKTYLSGSASWVQNRTTVVVNGTQSYKLIFAWRNNTTNTYNPSGCIDNVQLQVAEMVTDCWKSVENITWTQGANEDVLSWTGSAGATYDVFYWLEGSVLMDSVTGIAATSYAFSHGFLASGLYSFAIRSNCDDEQSLLIEYVNAKSLGDYSMIAEACPEVVLSASELIDGQKYLNPSCEDEGEYVLKPKVVAGGGSIAGYRVDQINYSECPFPFDINQLPAQYRNQITTITRDDYWDTKLIDLPFTVCFFDGVYRQALVGANGIVSFDPNVHPNDYCQWRLTDQNDIPNKNFIYKNCIMGVYQDYYPVPYAGGKQQIWYGVLGEWPCRKMVVCWNEVPMYNNHSTVNSSMIVMYEGTNVVDVYVKNRDLSPSGWNDNRGIIGIINADGSDGLAAPGRNTTDGASNRRAWSAKQEAWRFTPYSTPAYMLSWYKGVFASGADVDAYIEEHPNEDIQLGVKDSITLYNGGEVDQVTVRLQYSQCNGDYIDIVDNAIVNWPRVDIMEVDTFFCQGKAYSDKYINYADTVGDYEVSILNSRGCDSVLYRLHLTEKTKEYDERFDTICDGDVLIVEGLRLTKTGDYPVAVKYPTCDCDSLQQTVHLFVQDMSNFNIDSVGMVCADDANFFIGLESSLSQVVYSLIFDDKAKAQGLEDVINDTVENVSELIIELPDGIRPDNYTVLVRLVSTTCGGLEENVRFTVNYPSSITPIKWNNVIPVLDADYNGGYDFATYQWYKDGEPILSETGSYLHDPESLEEGAYYQVALTRTGEDYAILSCPVYFATTGVEQVLNETTYQKVIVGGQLLIRAQDGWYNALGQRVQL